MSVQAPPRVPLSIAQVEASHRLTAHPVRMVGVQNASKCEALDDTVLAKLIQRSLDGRFRLDLPIASHDLDASCTPTMGYTRGHGSRAKESHVPVGQSQCCRCCRRFLMRSLPSQRRGSNGANGVGNLCAASSTVWASWKLTTGAMCEVVRGGAAVRGSLTDDEGHDCQGLP
jgi:hypothetical protein